MLIPRVDCGFDLFVVTSCVDVLFNKCDVYSDVVAAGEMDELVSSL